jgi:hypothetical protein
LSALSRLIAPLLRNCENLKMNDVWLKKDFC